MSSKKEILNDLQQKAKELIAVKKSETETVFKQLSDRRGYRNKVYKPFNEILSVLENWIDSELDFYEYSFEQFQLSTQSNNSIEIQLIHKNGFNACVLFKTSTGLISKKDTYCFLGSIRDSENDQEKYNELGILAQNSGDYKTALAYFKKGFKIGNSTQSAKADIKDRMATCCMNLNKYKDAIKNWEEALSMKNWYPDERAALESDLQKAKEALYQRYENMVFVEGGTFFMGCEDGDNDEKPVHEVKVDDFYIDKYPVTYAQYCNYLNEHCHDAYTFNSWVKTSKIKNVGGDSISHVGGKYIVENGFENHPIDCVTWEGVRCYLLFNDSRLPTEAEWEFTARGGNISRGYTYSGSNKPDDVAWCKINSNEITHPVGTKKPNELEIYDMSGNVYEWCSDFYDENYYKNSDPENPRGPKNGGFERVKRGGDIQSDDYGIRCTKRHYSDSFFEYGKLAGFRCVKDVFR